jgi:CRISPR/Cas system endoribonuclease Cas6 (RAMP superfamily)
MKISKLIMVFIFGGLLYTLSYWASSSNRTFLATIFATFSFIIFNIILIKTNQDVENFSADYLYISSTLLAVLLFYYYLTRLIHVRPKISIGICILIWIILQSIKFFKVEKILSTSQLESIDKFSDTISNL